MAFAVEYSRAERLLHRIAFARGDSQLVVEDIESSLYRKHFRDISTERPIFLTSLPRAGTTMVLELLHGLPDVACTSYRDMPFVLAPLLWSNLSRRFRKERWGVERAHGDGVQIGYDSPEGFEEVFWKAFWPEHYQPNHIRPWGPEDEDDDATDFLRRHMQKIILLRRPSVRGARYLSKNNANIARFRLLRRMFPDAIFLVVLRDPLEHANSLFRQHLNFARQQTDDPFVARYMSDIGHYEFGKAHRPIMFGSNETMIQERDPSELDYWLAYWIAAFEEIESAAEELKGQVVLVPYETLCSEGMTAVGNMFERLGLNTSRAPTETAIQLRPVQKRADASAFNGQLVRTSKSLHRSLASRSILFSV